MRFLICILLVFGYADVHATPCEDTAYARPGTRPQRSPASGYVLTGFGLAMIAGGAAISDAGEKAADRCREEDSILKICDDRSYISTPVIGIGILSLLFGVVSLFEAYRTE